MLPFKMTLLMFTLMFFAFDATDKNFNEEKNVQQPMDANSLKKAAEIVPKWPRNEKISKQVHPYKIERENDYKIFIENTEFKNASPSNKLNRTTKLQTQLALSHSFSEDVLDIEISPKIDNSRSKKKCPACKIYISELRLQATSRMQNIWTNLGEKKQTQILASVCCPCVFIRYFPDLLTFLLWTIFYFESKRVCVSSNNSISCEFDQTTRDITGGLAIFFFLIRVLKYWKKQYKFRPRKALTPNYAFNI